MEENAARKQFQINKFVEFMKTATGPQLQTVIARIDNAKVFDEMLSEKNIYGLSALREAARYNPNEDIYDVLQAEYNKREPFDRYGLSRRLSFSQTRSDSSENSLAPLSMQQSITMKKL